MTPYADLLFFGLSLYFVVPAILLGVTGRLTWHWVLVSTLAMGVLQLAIPTADAREVSGLLVNAVVWGASWVLWQWCVAHAFLIVRSPQRGWLVWGAVIAALIPLVFLKYIPHARTSITTQFIGISYVTFRALDVVLAIHDGLVSEFPTPAYLAYLVFFPTLSAGPIDRFRRFVKDFGVRLTREQYLELLDEAVHAVFMGVVYKFVLGAAVRRWWLDPLTDVHGLRATVSYMYAYSAYLFFDFAGYSAFAIAFSKVFGIRTPENFNQPWRARDLADFWSRWHISLSTWLRDQVYMRFLMAALKRKWFASRHTASALGLMLSFGIMGIWHGAAWHYVVYGLLHGALLVWLEWWKRRPAVVAMAKNPPSRTRSIIATALTLQAVCVSFLIFSGRLF